MKYIIGKDIAEIELIYMEVFLESFPEKKYQQMESIDVNVWPVQFIDKGKMVGFCAVVDKYTESTLHCWIGGVLPEYRCKGIFSGFIDWIIQYGVEHKYRHITLNTDNFKPDILRILIKFGFSILDVKKTEYGDGNKIMLCYDIYTPMKMRLSITEQCNMQCFFCHSEGNYLSPTCQMPLSAIDRLLIQAQRLNFNEITITGGEPLMYPAGIIRIIDDCSRWPHHPYIKICTNGTLLDLDFLQTIRNYPGRIKLNISMHSAHDNVMKKITGKDVIQGEYDKLFSQLGIFGIDYRVNCVLLKGLNDSSEALYDLFMYAIQNGIKDIHMLELLVTKNQKTLIPYYMSIEKAMDRIKQLSADFNIELIHTTYKKAEFLLHIKEKALKVVFFRLSCRSGCDRCYSDNDIKIGPDMHLHPCYLRDGWDCGDAVSNLQYTVEKRDVFFQCRSNADSLEALYWGDDV